jgi:hypothetical protein
MNADIKPPSVKSSPLKDSTFSGFDIVLMSMGKMFSQSHPTETFTPIN